MSRRESGGFTYGDTLEGALKRAKGARRDRLEAELSGPPVPAAGLYLWRLFLELHTARQDNGFGPSPITYMDLDAWSRLTGRRLAPWEVSVIRDLDNLFLRLNAEVQRGNADADDT